MPKTTLALIAALIALAVPQAASAEVVIEGRGFGHGIGMSQYGAYGFALREDRSHRFILDHYYPGTTLERVRSRTVRVLLKDSTSHKICGVRQAVAANGRRVRMNRRSMYRVSRSGDGMLRVFDASARRIKARLAAPLRLTGSLCLRGVAQNGVRNGRYRGQFVLTASGTRNVAVINRVNLEHYLYGVVPSEMPTEWPIEAVKSQAVAARTYALRVLKPERAFDLYADVRSQMYRGRIGETARGSAAVSRTRGRVLTYEGEPARTFYFSTSGGRTAAIHEEWGGTPVPYLVSVDDPHDDLSPVHTWTVRLSNARAERILADRLQGDLEGIEVTARNSSGRATAVEIRGSEGTTQATGAQIRTLLGLRSTWFTITLE